MKGIACNYWNRMTENDKGGLKITKAVTNIFADKNAKKVIDGTIVLGDPPPQRPKNISAVPIAAAYSKVEPPKVYNRPPHWIGVPGKGVNTGKLSHQNTARHPPDSDVLHSSRIPTHVGSTYVNTPNYIRSNCRPPHNASVPKAYVPPALAQFYEFNLLNNRDATGRILGSHVGHHFHSFVCIYNYPFPPGFLKFCIYLNVKTYI